MELTDNSKSRFPSEVPTTDSEEAREGLKSPSFTHIVTAVARAMCIGGERQKVREADPVGFPVLPEQTQVQWQNNQINDPMLGQVAVCVLRGCAPNKAEKQRGTKMTLQVLSHWDPLSWWMEYCTRGGVIQKNWISSFRCCSLRVSVTRSGKCTTHMPAIGALKRPMLF